MLETKNIFPCNFQASDNNKFGTYENFIFKTALLQDKRYYSVCHKKHCTLFFEYVRT